LFCAGRLDKDAEGLLILTNDGELKQKITHPSFELQKTYKVVLDKEFRHEKQINDGIVIEERKVKASCKGKGNSAVIKIHEGRKHIVKKIFASQGYKVQRLIREAIGTIKLGDLMPGMWRQLNEKDLLKLR
jgi:pseudouridine synthase